MINGLMLIYDSIAISLTYIIAKIAIHVHDDPKIGEMAAFTLGPIFCELQNFTLITTPSISFGIPKYTCTICEIFIPLKKHV